MEHSPSLVQHFGGPQLFHVILGESSWLCLFTP